MTKANESAFPTMRYDGGNHDIGNFGGLTKRELFAAMAAQALISSVKKYLIDKHDYFASRPADSKFFANTQRLLVDARALAEGEK